MPFVFAKFLDFARRLKDNPDAILPVHPDRSVKKSDAGCSYANMFLIVRSYSGK
jgi:hypothetical protein